MTDVVKYAFIAGEISPKLFGRTDLTKYDLAVAEGHNFFVDYLGGLSTRPGFEFGDWVKRDDLEVAIFSFSFSPDLADNYLILFGHNYVRFIQDNAYVLEDAKTVTGITLGTPIVVKSVAHGYTSGRWVKFSGVGGTTEINSRTYEVRNPTANTFELYSIPDLTPASGAGLTPWTSGGSIFAVYEIPSPYASSDIAGITYFQYRDLARITSLDFPTTNLIRRDHTDWVFEEEQNSVYSTGPTIDDFSVSSGGAATVVFAVSKILKDGTESTLGPLYLIAGAVNYPATEGSVSVSWQPSPDASEYKVYRSIVSVSETLTSGVSLGYVGRTFGTKFTDPNITADFTQAAPINYNPFALGAIEKITISAGGSGYSMFGTGISISDPGGTGFQGQVVVNDAGEIVNVIIKSGGSGFTAPVITFTGGTGAVATAEVRSNTGTSPSVSCIYQQRQIYAASLTQPITIWGSQIKRFDNFNSSPLVIDSDSFEFDLDTPGVAPIRHLLVTRGGVLAMTQENVWLLSGGSPSSALTPTKALAEPQTYNGVSALPPLQLGSDVVFVEGKGYAVRILSYNEISKVYGGDDRSIASSHLFGKGKNIISWAHQESPFKTIWAVREDGVLLAFTVVKSEEVYAWTPGSTKGKFLAVETVYENDSDRVYVITQRFINNRWTKFFERQDLRDFVNVEDAWCVDAGLKLPSTHPAATLTIFRTVVDNSEVWTARATSPVFAASETKTLRAGNGVFSILSITSDFEVVLRVQIPPTNFVPETDTAYTFPMPAGEWSLDPQVTTIGGLWHLEGEPVSILADGNVFPTQTVVNGSIIFPRPISKAIIGPGFTARVKTLPVIIPNAGIETKRKRITAVGLRVDRTRGMKVGNELNRLYPMRERSNELYGDAIRIVNGVQYQLVASEWNENGQTYFIQDNPLPATILSLVVDLEVGDDPN